MPTATTTTLTLPRKSLKPAPSPALESLYNRAARAFLLRDIPLVSSLQEAAFPLLHPPEHGDYPDDLAPYRAKWDLLRITLETTLFTAPTPDVPESLRQLLSQPPHSLLTSTYHRSLQLFTPTNTASKALYIPSAVILTLVYSSLKLDAADAGRIVVEDWLATRAYLSLPSSSADDEERSNYRKVVEAYCLHILPKLEQWDYAKEFLDYESELARDARESIRVALEDLYAQAISARLPTPHVSKSLVFLRIDQHCYAAHEIQTLAKRVPTARTAAATSAPHAQSRGPADRATALYIRYPESVDCALPYVDDQVVRNLVRVVCAATCAATDPATSARGTKSA
ncbi:hypothetical protein MKEN_00668000 [Mycena kentingensis (nom. inval.)]|nr:hypothetical protein MKEN_00668000 [Mycena kentingensis (nom. inval.)]